MSRPDPGLSRGIVYGLLFVTPFWLFLVAVLVWTWQR